MRVFERSNVHGRRCLSPLPPLPPTFPPRAFLPNDSGLPLGGQFLVDALLADVIDYDEFLNGTRNEGGFSVFATFIPKVGTGADGLLSVAKWGDRA